MICLVKLSSPCMICTCGFVLSPGGDFLGRQRRYDWYVQNWDIAGKVKASKRRGYFYEIEAEFNDKYDGQAWLPEYSSHYQ